MKKIFFGLAVCVCLIAASNARAQAYRVLDTGDPAERVCNPKAYTDLGNGIVRDNVTGLEWVQDGNLIVSRDPSFDNDFTAGDGAVTWQHALDYIDMLNADEYLGRDDWRLPTIEELSTLVDAGRYNPAIDPVFGVVQSAYWSATLDATSTDWAWLLYFATGYLNEDDTSYDYFVRAVRGGPYGASDNFVSNDDGTMTDQNTGLMWQLCNYGQTWDGDQCTGSAGTLTWSGAAAYIQGLNADEYLGHDDWRLPTRNEFQSLLNYDQQEPATAFPNTVASDYWSSTNSARYTDDAWDVDFAFGYVYDWIKSYDGCYARAVRGGTCEPAGDDAPPVIGDGPFLAVGPWPVLPTSSGSAFYLGANYDVLWTFSDDFASCSGACTHSAEYQAVGGSEWTPLDVTANAANGYAYVTLPVESLPNATTYAFRFSVTDCDGQTTQSATYYFRTAVTDAPPAITSALFVAAGSWPALSRYSSLAMLLEENVYVLWTFSDDYGFCSGLCTHRVLYRKFGDTQWLSLPVSADPTGTKYAYTELPVESLAAGTYQIRVDVRDCSAQRTYSPYYYFKVEAIN